MLGRRRWMITGASAAALTLVGLSGSSCNSSNKKTDDSWRVGAYLSLSGAETQFGVDTKEGIELAIDEVNQAGGVKGKPIKVFYEDDKSNPNEANNKVIQLIDRDKVVALLGEVSSSRSIVGAHVANSRRIPMITPSSTVPEVTQVGPFIFRVCFTDDVQGKMGAEFVVGTMGKKRLAVLFATDDVYSAGLAQQFRDEVKRLGAEVVIEKSFPKTETNFTTYITEIRDAKPDLIYAPIYYTAMVPIARQAKAAGVKGDMFVGGDGWDANELLEDAGDEMEGAYFSNHYAPDVPWPNSKAFLAKYKERFKRDPTSLAAMGYDSAKVLADAIARSKDDSPDSIRQAIQETRGFQGATGTISIDADRNADKPLVIVKIRNKKFTYYSTVNDKTGKK